MTDDELERLIDELVLLDDRNAQVRRLEEAMPSERPLQEFILDVLDGKIGLQSLHDFRIHRRIGQPLDEHCRIVEYVASGGMGDVYRVSDSRLKIDRAVKLLRGVSPSSALSEQFLKEGQHTAHLTHPNIMTVHASGRFSCRATCENDTPYILMEWLPEAADVCTYVSRRQLSMDQRLKLFESVVDAVRFAHDKKILHRDLKPANILVTGEGTPKIVDFGLSRDLEGTDPLAVIGFVGTLRYASPEQVLRQPATEQTDIHALGMILYELLTERRFYEGVRNESLAEKIPEHKPSSASSISRGVSATIDAIIRKATAKQPEERYESAGKLLDDIRRTRSHRPVSCRDYGALERLWLFTRRSPLVMVLVVTLIVVGVVSWRHVRTRNLYRELVGTSAFMEYGSELWPVEFAQVPKMQVWLEHARELVGRYEDYRAIVDSLGLEDYERVMANRSLALIASLRGDDGQERSGLQSMVERIRNAQDWHEMTLIDEDAKQVWAEAIAAVAESPLYSSMAPLRPIEGLLPLGRDPRSHLWEFVHVGTGDVPARADTGELRIEAATGIVLVLLPGGTLYVGLERVDDKMVPSAYNNFLGPPRQVTIEPLMVSKYEVTQYQWERIGKSAPSIYGKGTFHAEANRHPVENIAWEDAARGLGRVGMRLPRESEWEYACRAGTLTPWFTGADASSLMGSANVLDQSAAGMVPGLEPEPWNDGARHHAPAGSYAPNAFGLYDTAGNVSEWCQDAFREFNQPEPPSSDRVRFRVVRGGSWSDIGVYCMSGWRQAQVPSVPADRIGIRAVLSDFSR